MYPTPVCCESLNCTCSSLSLILYTIAIWTLSCCNNFNWAHREKRWQIIQWVMRSDGLDTGLPNRTECWVRWSHYRNRSSEFYSRSKRAYLILHDAQLLPVANTSTWHTEIRSIAISKDYWNHQIPSSKKSTLRRAKLISYPHLRQQENTDERCRGVEIRSSAYDSLRGFVKLTLERRQLYPIISSFCWARLDILA